MSGPFGSSQWIYNSSTGFYPKTINGSLRFNDDDSAFLSRTPSSAGNRRTFTFSCWLKYTHGTGQNIWTAGDDANNRTHIDFNSDGSFQIESKSGGSEQFKLEGTPLFRDPAAWYNLVWAVDTTASTASDRVKAYINGSQVTFSSANYGSQSIDTAINNTVLHTIGKRSYADSNYFNGYLAEVFFIDGTAHDADAFGETKNGIWVAKNITSSNFTMGTNGFHLTFEDDTTVEAFNTITWLGDDSNGRQITGMGFNPDFVWSKSRSATGSHALFDSVRGANEYLSSNTTDAEITNPSSGYLQSFDSDGFSLQDGTSNFANLNADGTTYVAWCWDAGANNASTGHSSVTWVGNGGTQKIAGLPFTPDFVWIKNRENADDHYLYDSVRGPLIGLNSNQTAAEVNSSNDLSTFDTDGFILGSDGGINRSGQAYVGWAWDAGDSDPASNSNGSTTSTVKSNGDFSVITYSGNGASGGATIGHGLTSAPDWIIIKRRDASADWINYHSSMGSTHAIRFTNAAKEDVESFFKDTDPTDTVFRIGGAGEVNNSSGTYVAYAWRDVAGKQKFGTYTGQGNVTLGFRPGFVLIKNTTDASTDWVLYDASRNPLGGTAILRPNLNSTEASETVTITANGFTTGTGSYVGASGKTYIYMAFAGSYPDFITNVNTDGTIDSRVKASTANGFSIVSYIGNGSNNSTVGHGLGAVPDWVLVTARDFASATNWAVFHSGLGNVQHYLRLNTTDMVVTSDNTNFGTVDPTSSVMNLGYAGSTNTNGNQYIMYCWTAIAGRSAFGSYTGNASSVSVTTGFLPAFILIKRYNTSAAATNWEIHDNTRNTAGELLGVLYPNTSGAEGFNSSGSSITTNSTSFTVNGSGGSINGNNDTYIYAAFADTRDAAFWLDSSSNDNDFQHVNLDHNDTLSDSPTDNFATWNPLNLGGGALSEGNLRFVASNSQGRLCLATMALDVASTTNQYYWEITVNSGEMAIGIAPITLQGSDTSRPGSYSYYGNPGSKFTGTSSSSYGADFGAGDVIGVVVGSGKITFYKNGASQGDAFTGLTGIFVPFIAEVTCDIVGNFGQQPFIYGPPS